MERLSLARIDPPPGVYQFRGYTEPVDVLKPLNQEFGKYCISGSVIISGGIATITATSGDMDKLGMLRDFYKELKSLGATKMAWERHVDGVVTYHLKELK